MQIPSGPKGTRDFYPEDMTMREHIFLSWHRTCRRYGFEEFDAPMFEHLELYTAKSGAEIEKQLYAFVDKGERHIALRPEMTPSLARMVAARGPALKKPVRWYSIPRLFRYERMQKGRLREFFQLNMDILGVDEITADAELIAASVGMMTDLGLGAQDFGVHISSRKLLESYLLHAGVTPDRLADLYALLDRKHKIEPDQYATDLAAIVSDSAVRATVERVLGAPDLAALGAITDTLEPYRDLVRLFELLNTYGLGEFVLFDIGIVRGLAYYTGTVFELFDRKRSLRAIAGGGRYDRLVASYGGPDTPAVGFAAGDVVLGELLKEKGIVVQQAPRSPVFVICMDEHYPAIAISLTQELRAAGIGAEYALKQGNLGRQFKQADAARAKVAVIVGGDEFAAGSVKVKSMVSGEERTVARTAMVEAVRALLSA